ncbi:Chaperone protein fimC precursor [Serratia quinivorans]|uniref:Molecular chaperone n=1 Tax=Serratia proteamaculans TaxID=28151 RepID=A0ABS0TUM3_SERPR|nr:MULTISPECIES: molecular chaperone [Serratia]MBI6182056.1 molecular chaperone [Serratia proteamaculans]CAI1016964.1 Chaperone protein fimC precursor [Serratia quinivorans]CAI1057917.1 Chaperone protein fimC precursor [Serratia quinivorans]CAI1240401.1 Chaperone protein fimC precursor [Serratia quinivorans]CAI2023991.1 Chaperone protein fimC precursor [Serratia quinivorans]
MSGKKYIYIVFCFFFFVTQDAAHAEGGFSLGATRVIYPGDKKEVLISVYNTADNFPFLAQSWVSLSSATAGNNDKTPFIVTPPLYLQEKGSNVLHIIRKDPIAVSDRESIYWLNVKAIPSAKEKPSEKGGSLQFSYLMKLKLFYRPAGLTGSAATAYTQLGFSQKGNVLTVNNPTPYYMTFSKLFVGGREIKEHTEMVPPFNSQNYTLPAGVKGNVEYSVLNDVGGATPKKSVAL